MLRTKPIRADTFGSAAGGGAALTLRGREAAELTTLKFGSNFFVNLDQKRKRVRRVGGAPCAAARTERRKALFIFCRELPEKRRKENAKILGKQKYEQIHSLLPKIERRSRQTNFVH
ncbi:hypothetical protein A3D84_02835 [Candidatus Woesebacteria bacterium RIFCSPHIGHO2_02_FULL_42_20]|nr:MAG: hypothetical protein A2W15_03020 [Candidatus Woesebacteria bacterium RBG_16_41_13]OGM29072.1 MAG: hypothetical protein A2873_01870 [Candidatus Woesebacteria bacterium RIFCSPHIGHO2_01_FULL_42_80]OGM34780.1 MAG: hypothetical protein A3D84_02835 [Candidatus Woesebacteria bacterium RIFCSPHIGHO2_02_FULL_42_20]OGM73217.1 MAG: hypothetical protein A3H21_02430 [Candidatus Woesebacteria bacterium RIFCSPLOWO2_12_FULL_42_8]